MIMMVNNINIENDYYLQTKIICNILTYFPFIVNVNGWESFLPMKFSGIFTYYYYSYDRMYLYYCYFEFRKELLE